MKKKILIICLIVCFLCPCFTQEILLNFFKACANNDVVTCKEILKEYPDLPMGDYNATPLILPWLEIMRPHLYPKNGGVIQRAENIKNSRSAPRIAVICNSVDVLSLLIEEKKLKYYDLEYVLRAAVEFNKTECVKLLLENKVNPNINFENEPKTPLLIKAIRNRSAGIGQLLIEYGANVNVILDRNETALHVASDYGVDEIVKLLLLKGLNVDARDDGGETPFIKAAENNNINIMNILLKNGADINAVTNDNSTALIRVTMCTYGGSKDWVKEQELKNALTVKFLIEHNADTTINNWFGTALEWAMREKKDYLLEIFLGLDTYEELSISMIDGLNSEIIGKRICIKNVQVVDINGNNTVCLSDGYNQIIAFFEKRDNQLKIELSDVLKSLNIKFKEDNFYDGYADFYGYINKDDLKFHITNILENKNRRYGNY